MATDRMYDLAFQFRDSRLWEKFYDSELFALRFSDGETGYCSIMGNAGELWALTVYLGEEGYRSFLRVGDEEAMFRSRLETQAVVAMQNCLQACLEDKDYLTDEEMEEVRRYARKHGRKLRGKFAYPQFQKMRPGRYPWFYDSPLDEQRICEALAAALEVSRRMETHTKKDLGFASVLTGAKCIPYLEQADGEWVWSSVPVPEAEPFYPRPLFENEVLAARIRKMKKRGTWECSAVFLPNPVQAEEGDGEAPWFVMVLVTADLDRDSVSQGATVYGVDFAEAMNQYAENMLDQETAPVTLFVCDDRAEAILEDFCKKTGIRMQRTGEPEMMEEILEDLLEHMERSFSDDAALDEDISLMLGMLGAMSEDELRQMPRDLAEGILQMADLGLLELDDGDEETIGRLRELFGQ